MLYISWLKMTLKAFIMFQNAVLLNFILIKEFWKSNNISQYYCIFNQVTLCDF